jgi:hypothetical protein
LGRIAARLLQIRGGVHAYAGGPDETMQTGDFHVLV